LHCDRIATAPGTAGKQLFLLTNSAFGFVDAGMRFLIGSDWRRRRRWNGPSTLFDGSAPSASLDHPKARACSYAPRSVASAALELAVASAARLRLLSR